MSRSTAWCVSAPLLCLVLVSPLPAAEFAKWTDARGQVHYGDAPPPEAQSEVVHVRVPPPGAPAVAPKPAPPATVQAPSVGNGTASSASASGDGSSYEERFAAIDKANRESQARMDREAVKRCKAARNTYCGQGADAIRQHDYEHDLSQAAAQQDAAMRRGGVVPQGQRIKPVAPCQWPQVCKGK